MDDTPTRSAPHDAETFDPAWRISTVSALESANAVALKSIPLDTY